MKYCTYLTTYTGNKMPMFYIGRSNTRKIALGYRGSVSSKKYKDVWAAELVDNPAAFNTRILTVHDTKQEAAQQEEYFHKKFQVHKNPMYLNQATGAGSFHTDITGKNNPWFGKGRSGKSNPMYGKTHTEASRKKMSASGKGKHSHPKTDQFKQSMSARYSGKSYKDRFGAARAEEIKSKQRGRVRTEEHKQKIRDNSYNTNRPKLSCLHCQKEVSASNLKRWHNDNCKLFKVLTNPF